MTFPDGTHHDGYSAPAALEPLRQFVNSHGGDDGPDELTTPASLAGWLQAHGLLTSDGGTATPPTDEDLAFAVSLREALRSLLLSNHDGDPPSPAAIEVLNAAADRACMSVRFSATGWNVCACGTPGIPGALGRLLQMVTDAQKDGTWTRLKVCPAGTCGWAFYDVSRNRSRRWCSMEICGNRAKVGAYRDRERQSAGA
ncbi:CGNR zinc finger domain-containing protein [Paraconexibacter sp.]|uniref:CGNR zinc finger domain-containing protein n=1 Tax=Paraconexibacter sp. TaxID=2949640 RepID=UPI00356156DD